MRFMTADSLEALVLGTLKQSPSALYVMPHVRSIVIFLHMQIKSIIIQCMAFDLKRCRSGAETRQLLNAPRLQKRADKACLR